MSTLEPVRIIPGSLRLASLRRPELIIRHMELVGMIDAYLRRRRQTGELSDKSVKVFRSRLYSFAEYVAGVELEQITRVHVEDWLADCGLRPRSYNSYLSTLRVFYESLVDRGEVAANPCRGMKPVRVPPAEPRGLTVEEVRALLDACHTVELRAMVLLMVQLGLRCVEVSRLRIADVDTAQRALGVRGKNGDGGITRWVAIVDEAWEAIFQHLGERGLGGDHLFLDQNGNPRSPNRISNTIRSAFIRAGLKADAWDGRSAHALRHTCAEDMADHGATVRQIQRTLGHSSAVTTEHYLRAQMRLDEIRQAMEGRRYSA